MSGARAVTAVWPHTDTLVEFEVGDGTVTTTEDHEFWNVTDQAWQETQHIDQGDLLLTAEGATVEAGVLLWDTAHYAPAYDLTVDGIHTYHVTAGNQTVLVHNNTPCQEVLDKANDLGVDPETFNELATDPANGGTITASTIREAEVGVLLEQRGDLLGPLRRDPIGAGEFFDANGDLWDIKAFRSTLPGDGGRVFDLDNALRSVEEEFRIGENVILDTLDLDPADLSDLLAAIDASDFEPKLLVIVL